MQMYSTNLSEDLALFSAYMDSKAGYYTIIQFQLSSKACEDKGIAKYQNKMAHKPFIVFVM